MKAMYEWRIELYGAVVYVRAEDKLQASRTAARKAGLNWKSCARDMDITKLGRTKV